MTSKKIEITYFIIFQGGQKCKEYVVLRTNIHPTHRPKNQFFGQNLGEMAPRNAARFPATYGSSHQTIVALLS